MAGSVVRAALTGCLLLMPAGCVPAATPAPGPEPTVVTTGAGSPTVSPVTPPSSADGTSTSSSGPTVRPPSIASAHWRQVDVGGGVSKPSLSVRPTPAGRIASGAADATTAWAEVVALEPDADTPGMQDQFDCHWRFARLIEPDKPSWNLEPWRPVVDEQTMIDTGCNPGGPEI